MITALHADYAKTHVTYH